MREFRLSGSVEGVMSDHDSYSDYVTNLLRLTLENAPEANRRRTVEGGGTLTERAGATEGGRYQECGTRESIGLKTRHYECRATLAVKSKL
jgi:hypothetical protein